MKTKLVVVLSRFPYPLEKGDKLRAFHQIKYLSEQCDICLCALSDSKVQPDHIEALRPFCSEIHIFRLSKIGIALSLLYHFLFTSKPVQVGYFFNRKLKQRMQKVIKAFKPEHIYCQLIRTAEYVRDLKELPRTLDYMDALSAGMVRRSQETSWLASKLIMLEARRLKKYEHRIFEAFDYKTIISKSDRDLIFQYDYQDIVIVPNGIDAEKFRPLEAEKKFDLLFTGNMSYPPNVLSVEYLVQEIMPLIWNSRPETNLLISGANPTRNVKNMEGQNVHVTGWVDDIRQSYAQCRIFVAPMMIGSGLQNKLLEAMTMGMPCVTSELANRSLGAQDGVSIRVGKNAEHYSELILSLLKNEEQAGEMAAAGQAFAVSTYNWGKTNQILLELFKHGNTAHGN